ncbi:MAG: DUF2723 domain-containing protein [Verrucomicrobium sp.]|nr:DUF2723 domain-containing protein [Verrucomicrobium sp.]
MDWLTFILVTLFVMAGYLYTVAPDLTLEDSGELAVGSMYAGVPHPPGYPVWTLYSWLFTKILPFSSIAWRVAVSSAVAAALSAGLTALLISRGSSLILEGIDLFKDLPRRTENAITFVAAWVGGSLLGFNGFIWSQGVIVEVYTLAVLNLVGMFCLLLMWMYRPDRRRYLHGVFFLFGLCLCNHQTLIVAAMGIEVAIAAADKRLGRDFFLGNTIIWLLGLLAHLTGKIHTFEGNLPVFMIYNLVGLGSLAAMLWLASETGKLGDQLHVVLIAGLAFAVGAAFYLYMPLASASNPPMNWGYPRTWEGFVHAFTRGQYEKTNPSTDPVVIFRQLWMYAQGAQEEFNWANLLVGLVPFAFLKRMRLRERAWLIGLTAIYLCLAILLLILLNPGLDKSAKELVKVFFTSSHTIIALAVGYGLSIVAALLVTQYHTGNTRFWMWVGGAVACAFNLYELVDIHLSTVFTILRVAGALSLALSVAFTGWILIHRQKIRIAPILAIFALIPFDSILSHWGDNEQRGHLFGYWFGHDMFEPGRDAGHGKAPKDTNGVPLYPAMSPHAVLYGGTDPGRFCPTYMIFAESFTPAKHRLDPGFDRRDVYIITQNALADNTYLDYIRAHYHRSDQYQYDKPFFLGMLNDAKSEARGKTNALASLFAPLDRLIQGMGASIEEDRRAGESLFQPDHFKDFTAFTARVNAAADPLSRHLKAELGQASTPQAVAEALNRLLRGPSIAADPARFATVTLTPHVRAFAAQNPPTPNRIRLNRLLLEAAYPGLFTAKAGRAGGPVARRPHLGHRSGGRHANQRPAHQGDLRQEPWPRVLHRGVLPPRLDVPAPHPLRHHHEDRAEPGSRDHRGDGPPRPRVLEPILRALHRQLDQVRDPRARGLRLGPEDLPAARPDRLPGRPGLRARRQRPEGLLQAAQRHRQVDLCHAHQLPDPEPPGAVTHDQGGRVRPEAGLRLLSLQPGDRLQLLATAGHHRPL